MNQVKISKCQSCGDITQTFEYNGSYSCERCLGADRSGKMRYGILKEIKSTRNNKDKKKYGRKTK